MERAEALILSFNEHSTASNSGDTDETSDMAQAGVSRAVAAKGLNEAFTLKHNMAEEFWNFHNIINAVSSKTLSFEKCCTLLN